MRAISPVPGINAIFLILVPEFSGTSESALPDVMQFMREKLRPSTTRIVVNGERMFRHNAELTGRRRMDALPARCSIDSERRAGKVASRWRSG